MKLTQLQYACLYDVWGEKAVPRPTSLFHGNTALSLENKGLIVCRNYANGQFWELTDSGFDELTQKYYRDDK